MAVKRRLLGVVVFFVSVLAGIVVLSCAHRQGMRSRGEAGQIEQGPIINGRDNIMVFLPETRDTSEWWLAVSDELSEDFNVIPHVVDSGTTSDEMAYLISRHDPKCLILVDNSTAQIYRTFQKRAKYGSTFPPSIIVMSSFVEEYYRAIDGASGIAYEVPLPTVIRTLRRYTTLDIEKIGVIRRGVFANYVDRQRKLANEEAARVVEVVIQDDATAGDVRRAIVELETRHGVDAIWVLNDNELLGGRLLSKGWIEELDGRHIPVVVGVESLVDAERHFGSFAILPDHGALGIQTANLVFDLADQGWSPSDSEVQLPVSTEVVVDLAHAEAHLKLRPDMEADIDVRIE